MTAGINRLRIDSCGAAGCENDVLRRKQRQPFRAAPAQIEREQTLDRAVFCQQANRLHLVKNANILA